MALSIRSLLPVRRSLAAWAVLAASVVAFSYVFTLALALACVYLPYLLITKVDSIILQALALFLCGIVMCVTLIWSLVPRRDRFTPPGPLLSPEQQPRLFFEIEQIATAFNEPMPTAVCLTSEVNAWVAQRGGVMGYTSQRVMGIGLPLMQVLNVSQFRAVLAHEFGHFYEGDTRLGPWVFNARSVMVRTLANFGESSPLAEGISRIAVARLAHTLVLATLRAYWKLFMRVTQMVSRKQEYRADELACAVSGTDAMSDGLRRVEGSSAMFPAFWFGEVVPTLEAGYRPPIAEGFRRFLCAPHIAASIKESIENVLREGTTNAYDTHPPLRDRIAALQLLDMKSQPQLGEWSSSLLNDIYGLELQLIQWIAPGSDASRLKRLDWAAVGQEVYVPIWKSFVGEHSSVLEGITVASLPAAMKTIPGISSRMRDPAGTLLTREQREHRAGNVFWMAFALALMNEGWELHTQPAEFYLFRGEQRLNPIERFAELRSGAKDGVGWAEWCRSLGISDLPLVTPHSRDSRVLKIAVYSDGRMTVDGVPTSIQELRESLSKLSEKKGSVWYYREAAQQDPPPIAVDVLKEIVAASLPIRLSSKPDYSDSVTA